MNFKIFELHLLVNMVEGNRTYCFVGTLWWKAITPIILWVLYCGRLSVLLFCGYLILWKAIRPIILWVLDLEGYQTYYFVGTLLWKAIRPIILRVLYHGRLSDLLF